MKPKHVLAEEFLLSKAEDFSICLCSKTSKLSPLLFRHRQMLEELFDMDLVMKVGDSAASALAGCWLAAVNMVPSLNSAPQARTVREFDKQFTSVMFGYPTIDDYYEDASPCRKLKSVGIPVLCLNSVDDVFSPGHGEFRLLRIYLSVCASIRTNDMALSSFSGLGVEESLDLPCTQNQSSLAVYQQCKTDKPAAGRDLMGTECRSSCSSN